MVLTLNLWCINNVKNQCLCFVFCNAAMWRKHSGVMSVKEKYNNVKQKQNTKRE